jgi:hypothetical protein
MTDPELEICTANLEKNQCRRPADMIIGESRVIPVFCPIHNLSCTSLYTNDVVGPSMSPVICSKLHSSLPLPYA